MGVNVFGALNYRTYLSCAVLLGYEHKFGNVINHVNLFFLAREFALSNRVLRLKSEGNIPIDIAVAGLPYRGKYGGAHHRGGQEKPHTRLPALPLD